MTAMGSNLYDCNVEIKTQELGQAAARQLGVHERIFFHAGGFAVGSTFTSMNADPSIRVPTIGKTVCMAQGPFDFIFIDALHYEEAVFADLKLAATALTSNGVIAIHDLKGRWGSNVRRAVFRFLTEHDDFVFSHTPFTQLYEAIGFLWRRAAKVNNCTPPSPAPLLQQGLLQATILSNVSSTLVEMFAPRRVLQFCGDHLDMRTELLACGVEQVHTVHLDDFKGGQVSVQSTGAAASQSQHAPDMQYDLCLCLGAAEQLESDCATRLLQACVDASDRVVFGFTPPGEMAVAYPNLRPTAYWMQQFLARGYLMKDTIRPRLEPLTHADVASSDYRVTSTYLLNLYEVEREPGLTGAVCDRVLLETLLLSRESRIEDLTLQSLTQNLAIFDAREQLHSARQGLQYLEQERQRLQQENQSLQAHLEGARREITATQAHLEGARREITATQAQLEETQGEVAATQAQYEGAQAQLAATQVQYEGAQAQLAATQVQYEGAQAQLAATQEELAATQAQMHDKHVQLQETQAQLIDTHTHLECIHTQLEASRAQMQALETDFITYKSSRLVRFAHKLAKG
jgi:predicted  nucleic acid-binding Zn-ribbon protein